jgi:hypothetical protein
VIAEERHHSLRGSQPEEDHRQHQQHGSDRPVDEHQHRDDDAHRGELDELHASVAGDLLVGGQRRTSGDEHLEARRGRNPVDEFLDRFHRLVGQGLTLVAREIHLNVGGLAVVALCSCLGQRIAPEVLNVFDVGLVGFELVDELVVVAVCVVAQPLLALEHDHDRAVGLELIEVGADALHRDHRRRLIWAHRHRAHLADDLKRRHGDAQQGDESDPADDDRNGQPSNPLCQPGALRLFGGGSGLSRCDRAHD